MVSYSAFWWSMDREHLKFNQSLNQKLKDIDNISFFYQKN